MSVVKGIESVISAPNQGLRVHLEQKTREHNYKIFDAYNDTEITFSSHFHKQNNIGSDIKLNNIPVWSKRGT